mmetsp:Transcript_81440/g.162517  ORF Transcript_81440/g.162517 Transcript_81440/m.162517 type:complete len:296 (-) Transcript_81440:528-1415(-)
MRRNARITETACGAVSWFAISVNPNSMTGCEYVSPVLPSISHSVFRGTTGAGAAAIFLLFFLPPYWADAALIASAAATAAASIRAGSGKSNPFGIPSPPLPISLRITSMCTFRFSNSSSSASARSFAATVSASAASSLCCMFKGNFERGTLADGPSFKFRICFSNRNSFLAATFAFRFASFLSFCAAANFSAHLVSARCRCPLSCSNAACARSNFLSQFACKTLSICLPRLVNVSLPRLPRTSASLDATADAAVLSDSFFAASAFFRCFVSFSICFSALFSVFWPFRFSAIAAAF